MLKKYVILWTLAFLLAANTIISGQPLRLAFHFGANEPNMWNGSIMEPANVAGVVPQANWNNINGASGSIVEGGLYADLGGSAVASSVRVTWMSPITWASTGMDGYNNAFPLGGDRTLMTGYLDSWDTPGTQAAVTLSNLDPEFTENGYDVYVYFLGSAGGGGGAYTIGDTTKIGTSMTLPSAQVEDMGVDMTDVGTYLRFRNLDSPSFTLTADATHGGFRAPINGIQVVAVPEPSSLVLLLLGGFGVGIRLRRRN